ncbi:MAG: restriction endonuclease subunit S [Treponema sp.]|nr:restriction endonuclease subunit S [Treponema sp.]
MKKGDFAYNKSYSVGYDYGSIKRLDRYEDGVVSTLYICMTLTSDTNSDYLTHYFDSMKWNKSVSEISAEGARNHGLLNIPTESFFQTKHFLAPTLAEQQKIADFLSNVDSIITAETKILNTLHKKKKALMQKLFTRQLRFKSDDGTDFPEWEEKKMSDICSVNQGLQIAIENRLLEKKANCYFYITNEFIKTGTKYKYYIENPPKNVLCTKDDILMTRTGNTGIVVTDIDGCFHNNFFKINYSRDLVIKGFLIQFFKLSTTQKRILVLAGSSTIPDLNHKDFYSLTIQLPCKAEQQKIADCLSSMDSLIQNQQKVVTTWQQRKKALLQQMFV